MEHDTLVFIYKTFPFDFSKTFQHKSIMPRNDSAQFYDFFYKPYTYESGKADLLCLDGFKKSGNLSRGISAGNSQSLSIASDMNLQLAGNLTPELRLVASITDNNIPIQPDGNTQQIQDFDAVFIKLEHKNGQLTAGDFQMQSKNSNFIKYNKKSRGAQVELGVDLKSKNGDTSRLDVYGGFSIARGKYVKNTIAAIEGNQGPYKLYGAENESYIIILSASEKVYIDGQLVERGQNNQYVIDYNTAEITFTSKVLITKDKRIEIEFEYSERVYTRTVLAGGAKVTNKKMSYGLDFYSETDLKNQAIDGQLSDDEKLILGNSGDSLDLAFNSGIDSTGFFDDRVMYKMVDSLGYDSVFVYSTNSDSAVYQLTFANLGIGKGNYVRIQSSANGRVYQWVTPVNGIKQGEFEAIIKLISPKRRQMVSLNFERKIGRNSKFLVEMAFSEKNQNLFSNIDKEDDNGFATKLSFIDKRKIGVEDKKQNLTTSLSYDFVQKNFSPIERYRDVEFNRDWNNINYSVLTNEHLFNFNSVFTRSNKARIEYKLGGFERKGDFKGVQNFVNINSKNKIINFIGKVSQTNTSSSTLSTNFLRHNFQISKSFWAIEIGVFENSERNIFTKKPDESLAPNSYNFNEFGGFIKTADSSKLTLSLNYSRRNDYKADTSTLIKSTSSDELISTIGLNGLKNQLLRFSFSIRNLDVFDTTLSLSKPELTSQGKLEYNIKAFNNKLNILANYEMGSGVESKKEFSYIQVASGQGVYSWSDYNGNGVKELDEFEVAVFSDQANYIRVLIVTDDYIRTFGNKLNFNLVARPFKLLSINTLYNSSLKIQTSEIGDAISPFFDKTREDSLVYLNSNFRNSVYINRSGRVFNCEWNLLFSENKYLLVNGKESKSNLLNELNTRLTISKQFSLNLKSALGNKIADSEYFSSRDFNIKNEYLEPQLVYQNSKSFRISIIYRYQEKSNSAGEIANEKLFGNTLTLGFKWVAPKKSTINIALSYLNFKYNYESNNAIGYEMLEGFKNGENTRWNLGYQRQIVENLQLTFNYDGRKPASSKTIHTGSIQLRAFF